MNLFFVQKPVRLSFQAEILLRVIERVNVHGIMLESIKSVSILNHQKLLFSGPWTILTHRALSSEIPILYHYFLQRESALNICSNSLFFYICNDYLFSVNVGRTSRRDQEHSHGRISNSPPRVDILKYTNMNPTTVDWSDVSKEFDVILIVSNDDEFCAAYKIFSDPKRADTGENLGEIYFDKVGSNKVVLLKSSMEAIGGTGMQATCLECIIELKPSAIVCLGVCYGLNQAKHQLGDLVVSNRLGFYASTRVTRNGGLNPLALIAELDTRLTRLFENGKVGWKGPASEDDAPTPQVHLGLVLSGPQKIEDTKHNEKEKKLSPEAIAGDMEGEGKMLEIAVY